MLLQLTLTGSDVFQVKKGDRYGFTWLDLGVIDFDYTQQGRYCENAAQFNVGAQVNLVARRYGNRDYSISMNLTPKCEVPTPAPTPTPTPEPTPDPGSCGE